MCSMHSNNLLFLTIYSFCEHRLSGSKFLIYFHGNSEEMFQIENFSLDFHFYSGVNIHMLEYLGYSVYMGKD